MSSTKMTSNEHVTRTGGVKTTHSAISGLGIDYEEDDERKKIDLQLRLLASTPQIRKLPKWMKQYQQVSYVVFALIAIYSLTYLTLIGIYQANPRMQIQYTAVVRYLEYNSYSIMSPLLSPVLMAMLAYHVRFRVKLDEGDFFGVLGVLLFLALINIHDCWGILKLINWNRDHDLTTAVIDPPPKDDTSRNELHWQYAWSTRTICAKKFVRELRYKYEYSKKHVVRQIIFENPKPQGRSLIERVVKPKHRPCNQYHDEKAYATIRGWMLDVQQTYKCCGPYGYKQWSEWFNETKRTGCKLEWADSTGEIPSCFDPVMRWMDGILIYAFYLMLLQAIFYIISMFIAGMHHHAMKLDEEKVEKRCSLMSMTDNYSNEEHWWNENRPYDKEMVVGEYPVRPHSLIDDEASDQDALANSVRTLVPETSSSHNKKKQQRSKSDKPVKRAKAHKHKDETEPHPTATATVA